MRRVRCADQLNVNWETRRMPNGTPCQFHVVTGSSPDSRVESRVPLIGSARPFHSDLVEVFQNGQTRANTQRMPDGTTSLKSSWSWVRVPPLPLQTSGV